MLKRKSDRECGRFYGRALKSTPLCLEIKVMLNVLYANLLLHSFAKFYEPENQIRKKELNVQFLFPFSQLLPLNAGNLYRYA